jgi:site-specific recombinase XerD
MTAPTQLDQLMPPWLAQLRDDDSSPQTERRYRAAAKRFLAWHEVAERRPATLDDFSPLTLQSYRLHIQEELAVKTINVHVAALRSWGGWLFESRHLDTNPARNFRPVSEAEPPSPRGLTNSEVNALLRAAQRGSHPERDYAMIQMMLQTGMRIGECANLGYRDIEFGEKSGRVKIRKGKGNKYREVPLNESARSALAPYVAPILGVSEPASLRMVAQAWPKRQRGDAATPLWRSQKGGRLSASGMWRVINGLVAECAVRGLVPDDVSPHDLRHTFARRYLAEHPGDLVSLAQLMGHENINTTAIYTRPTAQELEQKVENMPLNAFGEGGRSSKRDQQRSGTRRRGKHQ